MHQFPARTCCATAALTFALLPALAPAATVVGGSDLLNGASAGQLETWLAQGTITLTNVFDKADTDTDEDFHAAADGKGATFSVIEVLGQGSLVFNTPVLIGGYNPQSWNNYGGYVETPLDADRTAFVFNLTQTLKFDQRKDSATTDFGRYQTYGGASFGPTFGGGHDLYVDSSLSSGYSYTWSYAENDDFGRDIAVYPGPYIGVALIYGQIEVFTITPGVPEPQTWTLMLAGIGLMGFAARRRQAHANR